MEHMPILDKQGNLLCSASEKLERFREFFSELLDVNSTSDPSVANAIQSATISCAEKVRQEKSPIIVEVQT